MTSEERIYAEVVAGKQTPYRFNNLSFCNSISNFQSSINGNYIIVQLENHQKQIKLRIKLKGASKTLRHKLAIAQDLILRTQFFKTVHQQNTRHN